MGQYFGLIELGLVFGAVFAFLGWQYWTVRDVRRPKPPPEDAVPTESDHFSGHCHKYDRSRPL
jgi:hypothetical protein